MGKFKFAKERYNPNQINFIYTSPESFVLCFVIHLMNIRDFIHGIDQLLVPIEFCSNENLDTGSQSLTK